MRIVDRDQGMAQTQGKRRIPDRNRTGGVRSDLDNTGSYYVMGRGGNGKCSFLCYHPGENREGGQHPNMLIPQLESRAYAHSAGGGRTRFYAGAISRTAACASCTVSTRVTSRTGDFSF